MAVPLPDLPRYLVLEPLATIRLEMRLTAPSCEIDVELENPRPGRSFVVLIGHKEGPFVQRVRLSGRARIFFDPQSPGEYVLLVANPQNEPIVLRLKGRDIGGPASSSPKKARIPAGDAVPRGRSSRNHRRPPKRTGRHKGPADPGS